MKLLDTCFLIDIQREASRGREGAAHAYLRAALDERFCVSVVTCCEFLEGFSDPAAGEPLLQEFPQFPVDGRVALQAARIRRTLRLSGRLIGDFDILIAATALQHRFALVTDNLDEFRRIDGLVVESYK